MRSMALIVAVVGIVAGTVWATPTYEFDWVYLGGGLFGYSFWCENRGHPASAWFVEMEWRGASGAEVVIPPGTLINQVLGGGWMPIHTEATAILADTNDPTYDMVLDSWIKAEFSHAFQGGTPIEGPNRYYVESGTEAALQYVTAPHAYIVSDGDVAFTGRLGVGAVGTPVWTYVSGYAHPPSPPDASHLPAMREYWLGRHPAEPGIASDATYWYTCKGSVDEPNPALSKFDSDWQFVDEVGYSTIDGRTLTHIGDLVHSSSYLYAPVQVGGDAPTSKIAKFDASDLHYIESWYVPDDLSISGVAVHDGDIWGVEHVVGAGAARILVFDGSNPGGLKATYWIETQEVNGIAFDVAANVACVTAGTSASLGEENIYVYNLNDIQGSSSLAPAEPVKAPLSYQVPVWWLHPEGLTFKGDELWVAKGYHVAQLDRTLIPRRFAYSYNKMGDWTDPAVWDGPVPGVDTMATVYGGEITVGDGELAEALDIVLRDGANFVQESASIVILGDVLDIRAGTYSVLGATVEVARVYVGGAAGASAQLNLLDTDPAMIVRELLHLGADGLLSAVPGSRIHMMGSSLENESTTPAALAGLANLTLIFEGGAVVVDDLEVAGEDLGPIPAGWTDNFVLGALQLGGADPGRIRLVDNFDNQQDGPGNEALYVDWIALNIGARIDFSNLKLYFLNGGSPKQFFLGDANLDGCADGLDYVIWSNNYLTGTTWEEGDFVVDGVVDGLDYVALMNNYGEGCPAAPGAVPEPSCALVLILGICALLRRRSAQVMRRRHGA